jgi:hypothetical protein
MIKSGSIDEFSNPSDIFTESPQRGLANSELRLLLGHPNLTAPEAINMIINLRYGTGYLDGSGRTLTEGARLAIASSLGVSQMGSLWPSGYSAWDKLSGDSVMFRSGLRELCAIQLGAVDVDGHGTLITRAIEDPNASYAETNLAREFEHNAAIELASTEPQPVTQLVAQLETPNVRVEPVRPPVPATTAGSDIDPHTGIERDWKRPMGRFVTRLEAEQVVSSHQTEVQHPLTISSVDVLAESTTSTRLDDPSERFSLLDMD